MKVAIIGSRGYTNKRKIKQFIWELKQKFQDRLVIVSGGAKDGADKYAKQFALEFDVTYSEFPPYHEPHNSYCIESQFKYGKEYNVKHFFIRNEAIIKYSDGVVAFVKDKEITSGTQNAVNHAKKHKKKVVFIS